jgi:hypothetical protein
LHSKCFIRVADSLACSSGSILALAGAANASRLPPHHRLKVRSPDVALVTASRADPPELRGAPRRVHQQRHSLAIVNGGLAVRPDILTHRDRHLPQHGGVNTVAALHCEAPDVLGPVLPCSVTAAIGQRSGSDGSMNVLDVTLARHDCDIEIEIDAPGAFSGVSVAFHHGRFFLPPPSVAACPDGLADRRGRRRG